jgi:tetratricopeptide (TPR) repeat protein
MSVQNITDSLLSLYRQGKYKDCLAQVELMRTRDISADEKVAALLLGAQVKRELTNFESAADLLENAKILTEKTTDPYLGPAVGMALNAVRAKLVRNKEAAKQLARESELLLNKIRLLERGPKYDRYYLSGLCDLGMTKIWAGDIELAAQNLRLACGLAEEKFGQGSEEMIYPSICLCIVHALEDKNSLSLAIARNTVQTVRANFGKHPLLIHPLYLMAQAATRQRLFQLALDTCRQVEGLIIDNIGLESDIYVDVLGMKTAAFMFLIEIHAAEKAAARRLKLMEKMRGKNDPKLIDPLCDMAQILAQMGEREKAEIYFDRALTLVSEMTRDKGFPQDASSGNGDSVAYTAGTRINDASLCHLEYELVERLSECYLWQGKLADVGRLLPASMRGRHVCKVDAIVSIIDNINKHFEERARNLELPT